METASSHLSWQTNLGWGAMAHGFGITLMVIFIAIGAKLKVIYRRIYEPMTLG